MSQPITYCSHCFTKNRLGQENDLSSARCGRCQQPLFAHTPVTASASNIESLLQSDVPVVIDCWASWCGPCLQFAPVFSQVAQELEPRMRFAKLDTEQEPALAARFAIRSIPTLLVFAGGKLLAQRNGSLPASVFKMWLQSVLEQQVTK